MRAAADRCRHRGMAGGTFGDGSGVALQADAECIVLRMRAGVFSVGRTVAGFALQSAMAFAEPIETEAGCRRIGAGREARIRPHFGFAIGGDADRFTQTVVVAGLTIRLFQPAGTRGVAHVRHVAVTVLAGLRRCTHCATQALGFRARVTHVAGSTIGHTAENVARRVFYR